MHDSWNNSNRSKDPSCQRIRSHSISNLGNQIWVNPGKMIKAISSTFKNTPFGESNLNEYFIPFQYDKSNNLQISNQIVKQSLGENSLIAEQLLEVRPSRIEPARTDQLELPSSQLIKKNESSHIEPIFITKYYLKEEPNFPGKFLPNQLITDRRAQQSTLKRELSLRDNPLNVEKPTEPFFRKNQSNEILKTPLQKFRISEYFDDHRDSITDDSIAFKYFNDPYDNANQEYNKKNLINRHYSSKNIDRIGQIQNHLQRSIHKFPSLQTLNVDSNRNSYGHCFGLSTSGTTPRIFCTRHGERIDTVFGGDWALKVFDSKGLYKRINLNFPAKLPYRQNPLHDFRGDSPLTEVGMLQAKLTGRAFRQQSIILDQCYSSPAFRSVQTTHHILKGLGIENTIKIKIEPGLFEFIGWYDRGLPHFLTPNELASNGYNIDLNYVSLISLNKLNIKESYLDYYNRSFKTTLHVIEKASKNASNILLSGHAATLEVCTRQLCGYRPRSYQVFNNVIRKVPFLGLNMCEKEQFEEVWRLRKPPIPPIQHSSNYSFEWKQMC